MTKRELPATAGDRLDFLLDTPASASGDEEGGFALREGTIFGRSVLAVAFSGPIPAPLGKTVLETIAALAVRAAAEAVPLVLVLDDWRLSDSLASCHAFRAVLDAIDAPGRRSPVLCGVLGCLTGPAAMLASGCDVVCKIGAAELSLAGRDVAALAGADGPGDMARADRIGADDASVLASLRRFVALLDPAPSGLPGDIGASEDDEALERLIGSDLDAAFDVRRLLRRVVDPEGYSEIGISDGLVAAIAKIGNRPVGILASDSSANAGVIGRDALLRALRLAALCERLGMPLVAMLDSPGILPEAGALDALAALRRALAAQRSPILTLVLRRAIGAVGLALIPVAAKGRLALYWPTARIGLTRAGSVAAALPPDAETIAPTQTRARLISALRALEGERP